MNQTEEMIELSVSQLQDVLGEGDVNLIKIERGFAVEVFDRAGMLHVKGEAQNVKKAVSVIRQLAGLSVRGTLPAAQSVDYVIELKREGEVAGMNDHVLTDLEDELICHTTGGKPVKPKTLGQKAYVDAIRNHTITFGLGPAGTGKTYLAMALAITAFRNEEVSRIILTRPAIEAGEKLGFLPGDLQSKVDPYLRPLYDALHQIMGTETYLKNAEKGLIEVAPLAYMRGRTLDNAYIILDEAQNTSPAQMKMFLTRIGFGSKVVVTGDKTQKDLPKDSLSGLDVAEQVLKNVEDIAFCTLTSRDVVRHPLVLKIVKAYEEFERRAEAAKRGRNAKRRKHGNADER